MTGKKKILLVIDSLEAGGAETMFVDITPQVAEVFELHLVTLDNKNDFDFDTERYFKTVNNLDYKGYLSVRGYLHLRKAVRNLRAIIKELQPDLVHAQLFLSVIISRFACPKRIPLLYTIHFTMEQFGKPKYLPLLFWEKLSYRKEHNMIGVAGEVIKTFSQIHRNHQKTYLLYNYVRDEFYENNTQVKYVPGQKLRMVAVNNLRLIKNVPFLIDVMKLLKGKDVELDIYGAGDMFEELTSKITSEGLTNVHLMGQHFDLPKRLSNYHLFLSASVHEGFGIAVTEAMSIGLPIAISNLPVYQEVAGNYAWYFNPQKHDELKTLIEKIYSGEINLNKRSLEVADYSNKYRKGKYTEELMAIYQKVMAQN